MAITSRSRVDVNPRCVLKEMVWDPRKFHGSSWESEMIGLTCRNQQFGSQALDMVQPQPNFDESSRWRSCRFSLNGPKSSECNVLWVTLPNILSMVSIATPSHELHEASTPILGVFSVWGGPNPWNEISDQQPENSWDGKECPDFGAIKF